MDTKIVVSLVVAGLASSSLLAEPAPRISPAKPRDGVYVTYAGFMTTVLELKEKKFRYWFETDDKPPIAPSYPIEGEFTVNGNTIELHHDDVSQNEWTFRDVNGVTTLWRPDALKMEAVQGGYLTEFSFGFKNFQRCGTGAILVSTKRPAETAWKKKLHIEMTEEVKTGDSERN